MSIKEEIKFNWNGSFVGTNHSMTINGKEIFLGGVVSSEEEATAEAVRILKEEYNIDYNPNNVNFTWGGRL
jgi:hypothetical protein